MARLECPFCGASNAEDAVIKIVTFHLYVPDDRRMPTYRQGRCKACHKKWDASTGQEIEA